MFTPAAVQGRIRHVAYQVLDEHGAKGTGRVSDTIRECLGMVVENQVHESLLWISTLLKASCL